ncbi:hypothetical protein H6P81_013143 [Aristolochia fimbriata]|uniref:Uncharacterized protein n=1 Tax=Aristolochia fimbriata TaxID=158543 RepID=A0AAV7EDT8_ARIFI|nr:hypothetical protein H6P81_013143 [Aristolochia fimbriata]
MCQISGVQVEQEVVVRKSQRRFHGFLTQLAHLPHQINSEASRGKSSLGCIDNLFSSVKELSASGHTTSKDIKTLFLCPKLTPYFSCSN